MLMLECRVHHHYFERREFFKIKIKNLKINKLAKNTTSFTKFKKKKKSQYEALDF